MKTFAVNTLVTLIGTLTLQNAQAAANDLLWNGKTFSPALHCESEERAEIAFRAALFKNGALVRINGVSRLRPAHDVRVTELSTAKSFEGPRAAFKTIGDRVLELKAGTPAGQIGKTGIEAQGTFWQPVMSGTKFVVSKCGDKTYSLFDVYSKESMEPVATVGVSAENPEIFRSAIVHTSNDAETALNKIAEQDAQAAPAKPVATNESAPNKNSKPATTAPTVPRDTTPAKKTGVIHTNAIDYVVCIKDDALQVRSKDLKNVLFSAQRLESVKPLQSFGTEKQTREIGGKKYTFINVKFENRPRSENTGWVAESYIKLRSECEQAAKPAPEPAPQPKPTKPEQKPEPTQQKPQEQSGDRDFSDVKNIKDANCCDFPIGHRPTSSYREGMRRFGAGRQGGRRTHAACDLYGTRNENIYAVAPGTVLRKYAFYSGLAAMEVRHPGGLIVLYGEITFKNAPNTQDGRQIRAGQVVGYMGQVHLRNCCEPMLHFELYAGTGRGPLLKGPNAYRRRADLMNPTAYIQRWEKAKFGASY